MSAKVEQSRIKFLNLIKNNDLKNNKLNAFDRILQKVKKGRTSSNRIAKEKFNEAYNVNAYAKYIKSIINNNFNKHNSLVKQKVKKNIRRTNKKIIKYPWYLAKVDIKKKTITKVPVKLQVLSKNPRGERVILTINWAKNNNIFPLSKVSTNVNNYIVSQSVGKYCNSKSKLNWCKQNHVSRYSLKPTNGTSKYTIKKNGASGVGVPQMSKEIKKQSLSKIRRSFLDLKRSGDYGQIITCNKLNNDNNLFIINPGSTELAKHFMSKSIPASEKIRIEAIKNNRRYAYHTGCFWSFDRPACFFAFLLGVPTVYQKGVEYFYYPGGPTNKKLKTTNNVLRKVLDEYNTSVNKNDISSSPYWYILVSIIDTAHDFGHGSRIPTGFQFKQMIKDNLIPLVKEEDAEFVEETFKTITNVERDISILLTDIFVPLENNFLEKLENDNRCIIYDAGKIEEKYRHRAALLSAKYVDPSST